AAAGHARQRRSRGRRGRDLRPADRHERSRRGRSQRLRGAGRRAGARVRAQLAGVLVMSVRVVVLALVVGSCGSSSRAPQAEADRPTATSSTATQTQTESSTEEPFEQPFSDPPPLSCTMAGDPCPSSSLRQFTTELDADGWARLRARAEQGMIAVALGDRVRLVDACELPGRYHEAAAGPDSPGRAWIGDRLVLLPDEARDCGPATHFVAGF